MFKKLFLIIVIVVALVSVATVLYLKFKGPAKKVGQEKSQYSQEELDARKNSEIMMEKLGSIAVSDKDLDGILDADEVKYKTSPTSSDTDKDGLLDKDEIELFKTDPTNADSDGDGFSDGYEARRGYNPNGKGKMQ